MAPCSPTSITDSFGGVDRDLARMYKPKKHQRPQPPPFSAAVVSGNGKKRSMLTVKEFRTKIDKVEMMIKENVRLELELLDKAMELQKFRQKLSVKYEKYAKRLTELKDIGAGEDGDDDFTPFVPAKLPPMLRAFGGSKVPPS